jgi:glycosyltransferase involved in cell wall biosynthesis
MKILVVPIDVPLPAFSGGRIDVWRRMESLYRAGDELALLSWYDAVRDGPPEPSTLDELSRVASAVKLMPITRSKAELIGRLRNIWRWPSHVSSRWVTTKKVETLLWARQFNPDAVLLDGLYGGAVARWLARELQVPLVYRSHNIEHLYMARLHRLEHNWKQRLGLAVNLAGLKRFEFSVFREARLLLDISLDDMTWWQSQGMEDLHWLPTSVDESFASRLAMPVERDIDVLYFGNLHTPNNVDAVRWLLTDIAPRLVGDTTRFVIAGSKPSEDVRRLVQASPRCLLIESPQDMAAVVRRAKVLVNPVRSGSGVNLKSVEMLFSNAALVSTATGVQGLPPLVKECFELSDDAEAFARAIDRGLALAPRSDWPQRVPARALFTGNLLHGLMAQACGMASPAIEESAAASHG